LKPKVVPFWNYFSDWVQTDIKLSI